jgi:hypothetical protein
MTFTELVNTAERKRWCTRPFCTTCGAHKFRDHLRGIAKDDVISGLRLLSRDFISKHEDMFRLVINEISILGLGGELLAPLKGTPAGEQLQKNIAYQNAALERRRAYLDSQTPEAVAVRRANKKAARARFTAPHRERKSAAEDNIRAAAQQLDAIPTSDILEVLSLKNFDVPLQAVGGLVYKRLINHYKSTPILTNDLLILSRLAESYSGYWGKILDKIS